MGIAESKRHPDREGFNHDVTPEKAESFLGRVLWLRDPVPFRWLILIRSEKPGSHAAREFARTRDRNGHGNVYGGP